MAFDLSGLLWGTAAGLPSAITCAANGGAEGVRGAAVAKAAIALNTGIPDAVFTLIVPVGDADATLCAALEISLDGGTNWREIGSIEVPIGYKGVFSTKVGTALAAFRYTYTNIDARVVFYSTTNAQWGAATTAAYIGNGAESIRGKKWTAGVPPTETLMV